MKKRYLLLLPVLSLAACASQETQTVVDNSVVAAEIALTDVERLAKIYTDLPRCGSVKATTKVCSDPALTAKIASLDQTAYEAVKQAKTNKAMLAVALTAIQSLRSAVPITSQ